MSDANWYFLITQIPIALGMILAYLKARDSEKQGIANNKAIKAQAESVKADTVEAKTTAAAAKTAAAETGAKVEEVARIINGQRTARLRDIDTLNRHIDELHAALVKAGLPVPPRPVRSTETPS